MKQKYEIVSIRDVIELADKSHSHFFDADTIKFFKSRPSEQCYKKGSVIYFITSERQDGFSRKWTVRKISRFGRIESVSKFQEYDNLTDARKSIMENLK